MLLLAQSPLLNVILPLLGSGLVGVAVFVFIRSIANTLAADDLEQDREWRYDVNRIQELSRISPVYRIFQPVLQALARFNRNAFREQLPEIGRELQAAGFPRFWTPEEYLGLLEIWSLCLMPAYVYLAVLFLGPAGIVLAIVLTMLTGWLLRRRLRGQALHRVVLIKRRLPFMLDLVTLLMEAGSTFYQALERAVEEFRTHPVGAEFGRVLSEMNMGKGRIAALEAMRDRLHDDDITGIIGSIIQGEQLGTPIVRIFRTQADVLRLKRSQRAEMVADETAVKMLLPGILIMASTVLIILGPFLINFIYMDFGT
ncbi:MAG TPA: type II secretion system F family protein [Planctomycetaceae bacterium]|nr:type II secretion system F family protein [Planctomycetaceae bacterium]